MSLTFRGALLPFKSKENSFQENFWIMTEKEVIILHNAPH